jgi:hypothetical protein
MDDTTGDAGAEAHEDDAVVEVADKPREPTPYEKKLRADLRKARDAKTAAERARDEGVAAERTAAEQRITAAQASANERIVRAELKAHAVKAGIVDLDGLRLLDVSGVKLNEAGDVENAEALIASLKTSKPYLFGSTSSSSTAAPPRQSEPSTKTARQMTQEEWRAARAKMLSRR